MGAMLCVETVSGRDVQTFSSLRECLLCYAIRCYRFDVISCRVLYRDKELLTYHASAF